MEIEQREVPYNKIFEDPSRFNELARAFAKEGADGVTLIYHLSSQYLLLAIQTVFQHGSLSEAKRYEKIADNLLLVGDKADNLLQILDPNSASHILAERNLQKHR